MGKIYRVLVIEQGPDTRWDNGRPGERVLFEAAGPDADRLLAYAPNEVAAALTMAGSMAAVDAIDVGNKAGAFAPRSVLVDTEALGKALATGGVISVGPGQIVPADDEPDVPAVNPPGHYRPADEPAAGNAQAVDAPAAPAKRKRRTRAEIEADKAAEALAAQQQASATPVEGGPAPAAPVPAGVTVSTTFAGAAPVPPAVAEPAPAQQPEAAPAAPAVPYNPFA
jgi:hypothetical protein